MGRPRAKQPWNPVKSNGRVSQFWPSKSEVKWQWAFVEDCWLSLEKEQCPVLVGKNKAPKCWPAPLFSKVVIALKAAGGALPPTPHREKREREHMKGKIARRLWRCRGVLHNMHKGALGPEIGKISFNRQNLYSKIPHLSFSLSVVLVTGLFWGKLHRWNRTIYLQFLHKS